MDADRLAAELETFFARFGYVARKFRWRLEEDKLRATVPTDGGSLSLCPLQALGWAESSRKQHANPGAGTLLALAGVSDAVAAAVVHLSDDLRSRYHSPALRERLLGLCPVGNRGRQEEEAVEL